MLFLVVEIALIGAALVTMYIFWLRPILRNTPSFKELYDNEDAFFAALRLKFVGIKQKVATFFITLAGVMVMLHDEITPYIVGTGADFSALSAKVPSWAWPILLVASAWLLQYFRNLSDKREG